MYDVCQCPRNSYREEWKTQQHVVNEYNDDDICDPHSTAVEKRRVWIRVAVSYANVHVAQFCKQICHKTHNTKAQFPLPEFTGRVDGP